MRICSFNNVDETETNSKLRQHVEINKVKSNKILVIENVALESVDVKRD